MKPSECLAKDTNGEESKKKLEKEKVKVKRSSGNFKLQQCIMNPKSNQLYFEEYIMSLSRV